MLHIMTCLAAPPPWSPLHSYLFITSRLTYKLFLSVLVNAPLPLQVGGNWVELPAGQYTLPSNRQTYCQIEAHARYNALISHAPEGEARG